MRYSKTLVWEAKFYIPPIAKQGVKYGKFGPYQPAEKKKYIKKLRGLMLKQKCPRDLSGKFMLEGVFAFPFRKKESTEDLARGWAFHTVRPDRDNLEKPIQDSLNDFVVRDDSEFCIGLFYKIRTQTPYIEIYLYRISEECN